MQAGISTASRPAQDRLSGKAGSGKKCNNYLHFQNPGQQKPGIYHMDQMLHVTAKTRYARI